ncbi:hypothetical protein YB2330_001865 [Saitoella coloradoensis]
MLFNNVKRAATSPMLSSTCQQTRTYAVQRTALPRLFPQTLVLSNGATVTRMTTSPKPSYRLVRDNRNNPLWNPHMNLANRSDESGRTALFQARYGFDFGGAEEEGEDSFADLLVGGVEPLKGKEYQKKKKGKK